jgi:hypothetical protein
MLLTAAVTFTVTTKGNSSSEPQALEPAVVPHEQPTQRPARRGAANSRLAPSTDEATSVTADVSERDEAATEARALARFEAALREFEAAPADQEWGPRASVLLEQDLRNLADKLGFEVRTLDCKSKRCVASLRWKSLAEAVEHDPTVASARYSIRCAVQTMGKPPAGGSNDVTTFVRFERCLDHSSSSKQHRINNQE